MPRWPPRNTRAGRRASISAIARRPAPRAPRRAPTSPIGRAAIRAGVELRTRCRVREIVTNEHGMASGVVYYDADGVEQFQPAEVVIVACNGIGTPRLLLNSASGRFPNGLANSSGLVGKNLMFHPVCPGLRLCRGTAGQQSRAAAVPVEQGVLRDRSRAALSEAMPSSSAAASGRCSRRSSAMRRVAALGRRASPRVSPAGGTAYRPVGDLRGPAGGA